MFSKNINKLFFTFAVPALLWQSSAMALEPPPVLPSDITVRVDLMGSMPTGANPGFGYNLGAPVPYGNDELLLVDQTGAIYSLRDKCSFGKFPGKNCSEASSMLKIFDYLADAPSGTDLNMRDSVLNVIGNPIKDELYVILTSKTLPAGVPSLTLPVGVYGDVPSSGLVNVDIYRVQDPVIVLPGYPPRLPSVGWEILYKFDYVDRVLSNPRAVIAFEAQNSDATHQGGAMELLPNGNIIWVTGDMTLFGGDGRAAPQDDAQLNSKMWVIDPDTGSARITAKGFRNVQRIQITHFPAGLAIGDIGSTVAEELNWMPMSQIFTNEIENYGWGRNADDGLVREGFFYIDQGEFGLQLPGVPGIVGEQPIPEAGYEQPIATFGREGDFFAAMVGPVISGESFQTPSAIFGNLSSGKVFAITDRFNKGVQDAYRVNLVDSNLNPIGPNNQLNDLEPLLFRTDPRFFLFPDGTAGVLLEATGNFYRMTEVIDK